MVLTSERRDTLPESPEGEKWSGGLEEKRLEAKMEQSTLLMVRNKSGDILLFLFFLLFFCQVPIVFFQGKDEAISKTPKTFGCSVRAINKVTDALLI